MADGDRSGVFVSWSKPASAKIANLLKPFLEDVLGTATIFMSQAMEGGTRWGMEIPRHLESCNAGLVLVTRENSHEPWLHFESGALSKHIEESRVVPLLCGASVGDIQGTPLSMFQAKSFDHDDFLSVCISFGTAFGVQEDAVRRRFEKSWDELHGSVEAVVKRPESRSKELGLADLMGLMERVAGQVATIEASLKLAGGLPTGMFGSRRNALGSLSSMEGVDWARPISDTLTTRAMLEYLRQKQEKLIDESEKGKKAPPKGSKPK